MTVDGYMRYRLAKAGADPLKVRHATFTDLCLLAGDEFGEGTLRAWGVWHVVEPYLKAAA